MSSLTHHYQLGMTFMLTAVTCRREKVFGESDYAQAAHEDIAFYTRKFRAASLAHVIMPDHVHWIIYPSREDFKRFAREEELNQGKYAGAPERFYLSKIMEDYKRHVAYTVNQLRRLRGAQVWQSGFRDDGLRSLDAIRAAVRYVVYNPVKAGLVKRPEDYAYLAWDGEWLA